MEEDFSDPKQVTEMLNKVNIYGIEEIPEIQSHEDIHWSPNHEDDILTSFAIFK